MTFADADGTWNSRLDPGLVDMISRTGAIELPEPMPVPARRRSRGSAKNKLLVDWPNCRAHGLCHEVLPELIDRDEWGYPVVLDDIPSARLAAARDAVRTCPTLALRIVRKT